MKSILLCVILTIALGCGKTALTPENGTHRDLVLQTLAVTVDALDVTDGRITAFDASYVIKMKDVAYAEGEGEIATITVKLAEPVAVGQLKLEDSIHIAVLEKERDFWTAVIRTDIDTDHVDYCCSCHREVPLTRCVNPWVLSLPRMS